MTPEDEELDKSIFTEFPEAKILLSEVPLPINRPEKTQLLTIDPSEASPDNIPTLAFGQFTEPVTEQLVTVPPLREPVTPPTLPSLVSFMLI